MEHKECVICNSVKASWGLEELQAPLLLSELYPMLGTFTLGTHPQVLPTTAGFAFSTNKDGGTVYASSEAAAKCTSSFAEQLILLLAAKCKQSGNSASVKFNKDKSVITCSIDKDDIEFSVVNGAADGIVCKGLQTDLVHSGATLRAFANTVDTMAYKRVVSIEWGEQIFLLREISRFLNCYLILADVDDPNRRFSVAESGCSVHLLDYEARTVKSKTISISNITLPKNMVVYAVKGKQGFAACTSFSAKEGRKCF